ncbi:MAG: hypothetical protein ACUVV6_01430 [Thermoplasmatota archaeon]
MKSVSAEREKVAAEEGPAPWRERRLGGAPEGEEESGAGNGSGEKDRRE